MEFNLTNRTGLQKGMFIFHFQSEIKLLLANETIKLAL
jgi:hypothetical protein